MITLITLLCYITKLFVNNKLQLIIKYLLRTLTRDHYAVYATDTRHLMSNWWSHWTWMAYVLVIWGQHDWFVGELRVKVLKVSLRANLGFVGRVDLSSV